jgi:leader peptidase (prepilin peptidase)/N-methyltransferase
MNPTWALMGALLGLAAGALLHGPVYRLSVPGDAPERTACPDCGTAVRAWFPGRCRGCGRWLARPGGLELVSASVLAVLFARFAGHPVLAAFAVLGVLGVALSAIDISVHRLPNKLTLPGYPVLLVLLGIATAAGHDVTALLRALLAALALAAVYLLLAIIRPGQLGGGDVKLAGLAGLALGWLGWPAVIFGTALGFVLSGLVSLGLLAARRITLRSEICFGPFLLGGALLAAIAFGAGT